MEHLFDVFIIGGGINGCGCAADAAMRGLKVGLCEKSDIASETSSKSTKLIHGGLRYLEQYDFNLVRKALVERQKLLNLAPHLVKPLKLILPYDKHMRPAWLIRMGLFVYDHLSKKNQLPNSRLVNRKKNENYFKPLNPRFEKGFAFYDGTTNDARLTLSNALQAKAFGADIWTRTELIQAEAKHGHWALTLKNTLSGEQWTVLTKSIINATGPWVEGVGKMLNAKLTHQMTLVKGSHIVVPKLYEGEQAYFLQSHDHRIIFVIPFHGQTMIGTTDIQYEGPLDNVSISDEEINYLCQLYNDYFNKNIDPSMVLHSWSGLRPLITETNDKLHEISRDYRCDYSAQPAPLVTIYGGKITTYRKLAKDAVSLLKDDFPKLPKSQTDVYPLPGAMFNDMTFEQYRIYAHQTYAWLHPDLLNRYLENYGCLTENILKNHSSVESLGIHFGHHLYQAEVDYLVKEEWARSADDILWRRSKLGLVFNEEQIQRLEDYL